MRFIAWTIRVILFLAALGFALSNTGLTELRFFGVDVVWRAPLVIFLLVFFAAGTALGLLGVVPMLYRQRREIARLRREIRASARPSGTGQTAAPPDVPLTGPSVIHTPLG
ncbi:MAG: LapA family protein [Burkholderiales bacterium]|nr:LapA family protein [Burkholderiales bacterium]